MVLRLIQVGNALPISFIVDPSDQFEPGMIGQLKLNGNQVSLGVSNGTSPIGIIDEIRTHSFHEAVIDEVVIAVIPNPILKSGKLVTAVDTMKELSRPNIMPSSFVSSPVSCELIPLNGILIFLAGTELNFDLAGSGTPDSIRTVVRYQAAVANIPGDDSVGASGKISVHFQRGIYATDQFETNQRYPLNSPLFSSECGLFTSRQIGSNPAVALVTGPPTAILASLELLWL